MALKRIVKTNNKEVYNKLNMLLFNTDVVIKGVDKRHINKILNNINKNKEVIELEQLKKDYFLLKKKGPMDILLYFVGK